MSGRGAPLVQRAAYTKESSLQIALPTDVSKCATAIDFGIITRPGQLLGAMDL